MMGQFPQRSINGALIERMYLLCAWNCQSLGKVRNEDTAPAPEDLTMRDAPCPGPCVCPGLEASRESGSQCPLLSGLRKLAAWEGALFLPHRGWHLLDQLGSKPGHESEQPLCSSHDTVTEPCVCFLIHRQEQHLTSPFHDERLIRS